jgi:hypothetical protein
LLKGKTGLRYPKSLSLSICVIASNKKMKFPAKVPLISLVSLSFIATSSLISPAFAQKPKLPSDANQQQPLDPNDPNVIRPGGQNSGILSIEGGKRLMGEADSAVASEKYDVAAKKLQEARQVFNQLSNFYQELNSSFAGIDNRIADSHRKMALDTAQMRDEATFRLALVHRAQNQAELAVPLLVQLIRSQNPTRELGKKAYQQLFELGFVSTPYPRSGDNPPPPKK